jgi:epoxyqueuosine reductase
LKPRAEFLTPVAATQKVKELAHALGFDLCGVTGPYHEVAGERYDAAMSAGYGADMEWLKEHADKRRDARLLHEGTKSVVMLGVSYADPSPGYTEQPPNEDQGWIARYAQGKDYHVVVRKMLIRLAKAIEAEPGLGLDSRAHRVFVDTGPFLEKAYAQMAGIGWIGKNSLLLNRKRGSWLFLGAILTPLDLEFDASGVDHCGSCTRCLDACPTGAFPEPYVLDARKCIATWTIESKEPLRDIVSEQLGQHVFGCDICQEVCPWNRKVEPSAHGSLLPREENVRPPLDTLRAMTDTEFRARFPSSAVRRTDADRMGSVAELIMRLRQAGDSEV